ncbi:bacillithiol system redox-active protein YtxJ [Raineya sp.]|jgi:bacillithiol system protein YtxJ
MKWINLENLAQLAEIKEKPLALIFKHSTRCSISSAALDKLQRNWKEEEMQGINPYFLDLIRYREISNQIAREFGVEHQSPQAIVLQNGKVIYHDSHFGIDYSEIKKAIAQNNARELV